MDIGEWIVVHRLSKVDGVENLDVIAMLQQSIAALDDNAAFRVCNHIAGVHLEKIRFQPEPCFS